MYMNMYTCTCIMRFYFTKIRFIIIIFLFTTITRLFGYLAEPVRGLTPCVDLWLVTMSGMCVCVSV